MTIRKNLWVYLFSLITIQLVVTQCTWFKPEEKILQANEQVVTPDIVILETQTSTPIPTNLVKLQDDGTLLPPQVLTFYPAGGEEIGTSGTIWVKFNQEMDQFSTSAAWKLLDPNGVQVEGKISWPSSDQLNFKPIENLSPGIEYQVRINNDATSADHVRLSEEIIFPVNVAGDLQVSQVFPADGTLEVESNSVVTVIFNRAVVPLTTVSKQSELVQPLQFSPPIAGHGEWLSTSVYVFHPEEPLLSSTMYRVSVIEGLVDVIGSILKDGYQWSFTTTAPSIASFGTWSPNRTMNPENNLEDIYLESSFFINFNQPMDESSVSEAFSIFSQSGENLVVDFDWVTDYQLIITPTEKMSLETHYTLLLQEDARALTGGTLEDGLRWNFQTLPIPGISHTSPETESIQSRYSNRFGIYFNSPMNVNSFEGKVTFQPEIEEISWHYSPWGWNLNFYGIEPSINYTVKVSPGLEDIYGNKTTQGYSFTFRTADRSPAAYLDLPYSPSIYTRGGENRFVVSYVNVRSVEVDLYAIPTSHFVGFNNGSYSRWDFIPPDDWLVNSWYWENSKARNEFTTRGVHLTDSKGNLLETGFYLLTINSPQIQSNNAHLDTRLLIQADANLTFKTTLNEGLMWLTDLVEGEPIVGVQLSVYDDEYNQVGTGTTNSDGILILDLPVPDEIYRSRYAMTQGEKAFAFAISDWGSGISPYEFGVWSDFYTLPDQPTAYLYTDRPLYRPGQTISFKGVLRQNNDLVYKLLPWDSIEVEINSYNELVYKEILPLTDFGTFNGEFVLDENAALGYYSIIARYPGAEESVGGVSFSVADYRKPEFQVTTSVDPVAVLHGQEFTVDVGAEYFSGGGVANAEVNWALGASEYFFQPTGDLSRYSFFDYDRDDGYYNEEIGGFGREILASGVDLTDANGNLHFSLLADLSASGNSQQFTFEATVTDIAGTSVSDQENIIAHKAAFYPGVRPQGYVGMVGEQLGFDLIVVDWDGDPVTGTQVDVEIVERRWSSVQEQDAQGYWRWTSTVEEIPVISYSNLIMDADGKGTVLFTPEKGGIYKAKVSVIDDAGNQAFSGASIWVSSNNFIAWRQTNDRRLELISDKEYYLPGEAAEILIASPFPGDNYALITIERGQVMDYDVVPLESNSTIYRLPITLEMAPNIYVSVLVIQGSDAGGKPDFRNGIVELNVATEQREIKVDIFTDQDEAGPGDQVTYSIRTMDYLGNPVQAEVSLALVDLANLTLSQPNSVRIKEYFFNTQALGVRTAVPIVLNIEHYISTFEDRLSEGEGMGSGGGKGADLFGVLDIRGDFRDTAFWQANVITDVNGEAEVTVTLPDNLTIWRMDARAVTLDTLVGDSQNDLRSTKPLLIRPQTPRFFVVGDTAIVGAAVHNNTKENLNVQVSLDASGVLLSTDADEIIDIPAGNQAFVTWEIIVADDIDRVDMVFKAIAGKYSDATRPTVGTLSDQGIPVYRYEALETVGTSGVLFDSETQIEGISIPSDWGITKGSLEIKISPSLVAGMSDGLDYLEHYPYECIEQTVSRFLPNVLTSQALEKAGLSNPNLRGNLSSQINLALQRLYNWQRPDGGWGWWPESDQSDPLNSAYVIFGLIEAKNAGYQVNSDTLRRGLNYLKGTLQTLGNLDSPASLNRQAFVLFVLARAGEPQISLSYSMYDIRQSLSIYARAYLAEILWRIDPQDSRIETIESDFINHAVLSATGIHWQEDWQDYWNWNTDTRTSAIVLGVLLKIDPGNKLNINAMRWLMSNRANGHWRTTQETSWTLIAFSEWLKSMEDFNAEYNWAIGLNGNRLIDGSVNQNNLKETFVFTTEIKNLVIGEINRLAIARDEGPGNLYYTSHLDMYLPVDEIQPLDRGIMISRDYYDPAEVGISVSQANQGDVLLARLTIVAPNDLHYVVIDDPLPAGMEAVDQSLETSPDVTAPAKYDYETIWKGGWGWWFFDHVELRDERIVISADYLPAGTYVYTYLVRASFPGTYYVIPPTAQEFYFPEVNGRGAGSIYFVYP